MVAKHYFGILIFLLAVGCGRPRGESTGDADNLSCTEDSDCPGGTCESLHCVYGGDSEPECTANNQCASGLCQDGRCWVGGGDNFTGDQPCESDDACEAGEFCHYATDASATTGLCHPLCGTSADCYFGQLCYAQDQRCYTLRACDPGEADCPPGEYCDPAVNACTYEPHNVVDWCRLERPVAVQAAVTQTFEIAGRVYKAGTTDRTSGIDNDPQLTAMVGFGPVDSTPVSNPAWVWFGALGNVEFFDTEGGETDEYVGFAAAPFVTGDYAIAMRFSGDGGLRWTVCDRDTGEPGDDGSEDGWQH